MCIIERKIYDETIELKDNAMLKARPDLFEEWDFDKNDKLGYNVYKITRGSEKVVFWKCSTCKSEYDMMVNIRLYNKKCPYCSNRRVNSTNSIASLRPDLAKQWHPTKNGELTPSDVPCKSSTVVWWMCEEGHEWEARASDRSKYDSSCCATCINKKLLKGYNDLFTTHPEIANLLLKKENGNKYTYGSKQRVDWKCPTCDEIIKDKSIEKVISNGLSCPNCTSTSMKYPERVIYHLLKEIGIEFSRQETFDWSDNKVYDFFLPSLSCIIETHGEQHYNGGFSSYGGRTLEEEQENDKYKFELAVKNKINNYIIIDCSKSDFEFIMNNILKSELVNMVDLSSADWDKVNMNSQNSMNLDILKLWNDGLSLKEIVEETKVSRNTISKILQNFDKLGKCEYDTDRGKKKNIKVVFQFDLDFNFIRRWDNASVVEDELGYNKGGIRHCCNGRYATSQGFIWRYEKDLKEEFIK